MSRIWLVARHTLSQSNENMTITRNMPDCEVMLSNPGLKQGLESGQALLGFLRTCEPKIKNVRFIASPYKRARQTMDLLASQIVSEFPVSCEVHSGLHEKKMGLYEGYKTEDLPKYFGEAGQRFCDEFNDAAGKFYARPPDRLKANCYDYDHEGESYQDAVRRAEKLIGELHSMEEDPEVLTVIVGHGRFNSFLEKSMLGLPDKDYLSVPIHHNGGFKCFVKTSDGFKDQGMVFDGFWNPKEHATEKLQLRS